MIHNVSGTLAGPMVDEEHMRDLGGWDQIVTDDKYTIQTHLCAEFIETKVEGTGWAKCLLVSSEEQDRESGSG